MNWASLLFLVAAALMGWLLYRQIKNNPQGFSKENISKSIYTLGILALLLIFFIGFLIFLLRAS
jgi:biotin transporter BioY